MDLKAQKVLIVGGSTGMGLATAKMAEKAGAKVIIAGHNEEKSQKALTELSDQARAVYVDVVQEGSIREMLTKTGKLDHIFVTAAPGGTGDFKEAPLDIQETYIYGKFWSLYLLTKLALPQMREDGSITFITGGFAQRPEKGTVLVTAAFQAVEGFARALAVELAPLRFNVIRPGLIDSGFWDFLEEEERQQFFEKTIKGIPSGRKGESEDIAHAALFLMSNSYVNGQIIEVNGGQYLS